MHTGERSHPGRLVRFRLDDLPLDLRVKTAARLQRALGDHGGLHALEEAVQLERAAKFPSATVYRIPEQAWAAVMGDA